MSFEWADICPRCELRVRVPDDGLEPADHLCVHDVVTEGLLRSAGLGPRAARSLLAYGVHLGMSFGLCNPSSPTDPRREGPFLHASPPPIALVSDLLLWSRSDLLALPGVGKLSVEILGGWLAKYGFALAERDGVLLRQMFDRLDTAYRDIDMRSAYPPRPPFAPSVIALPETEIAPGDNTVVEATVTVPLRIVALYIPYGIASTVSILSFRVGSQELLVDAVPGLAFSTMELDALLDFQVQAGEHIAVRVANETSETVFFRAVLRVVFQDEATAPLPSSPFPPPPPYFPSPHPFPFVSPFAPAWVATPPIIPPRRR